jgi:serine protease Do
MLMRVLVLLWLASPSALFAASLPDFTELVAKSAPAVVNISTTKKTQKSFNGMQMTPEQLEQLGPWGGMLKHFFEAPGGRQGRGQQPNQDPGPSQRHHSLGSGFIISKDGYVITNNHVIDGADEVLVKLNDRRELIAEVVGKDKSSDIALLKVDADNLPVLPLGQSEEVKVGEWVLAIGSPFGFEATVTAGIVSAKGRALPNENYVPFLQTDVAINPGNSGGPLFNLKGEVVGVNSQIYSRTGGFMGLSFAIPIDVALDVMEQLKTQGKVSRGWLGVAIQEVTRDLAESFGLDKPQGALVSGLVPDGPAEASGILPGDVILAFNGDRVVRSSSLPPLVGRVKAGSKVAVLVQRNGKPKTLSVKLGELGAGQLVKSDPSMDSGEGRLGITVVEPTSDVRNSLRLPSGGVLIKNLVAGAAAEAGVRRGDVITHINNQPIKSVKGFEKLLGSLNSEAVVPFLVARPYGREFLAVRIP